LKNLADIAAKQGEPEITSGRQEYFENLLNDYL
jgi:xylose isomerase